MLNMICLCLCHILNFVFLGLCHMLNYVCPRAVLEFKLHES